MNGSYATVSSAVKKIFCQAEFWEADIKIKKVIYSCIDKYNSSVK